MNMEQGPSCQQADGVSLWMSLALDGELSANEEEQLQAHLTSCPACQAEWEAMRAVSTLLAKEPMQSAPWGFSARVDQRISQRTARPRRVFGGLAVVTGSLSALAAALVLLVGVAALLWNRVGTPAPIETAVDSGSQVASGIGLVAKSASLLLMDLLARYGLPVAAIAALIIGYRLLSRQGALSSAGATGGGETVVLQRGPCPPITVLSDGTVQIPMLQGPDETTCTLSQEQLAGVLDWARSGTGRAGAVMPDLSTPSLPAPGLRSIHSLRRLDQARRSGAISPDLVDALEADWEKGPEQ